MKSKLAALLILVVVLGLLLPEEALADFNVPEGFVDEELVANVTKPTAIDWLPPEDPNDPSNPDNLNPDILIATQRGVVYRAADDGIPRLVLDLSGTVCSGSETGLLGLAVDPDFATGARFIYLYYTDSRGAGDCGAASRANRVSRFTMTNAGALVNEQVLIDNIPAPGGNHNGGDLQFGNDELLYISVGDGGQDLNTGAAQDANNNARRLDVLVGKILRIEKNGSIPTGNPFQGAGTGRCAATGGAQSQVQDGDRAEKKRKGNKKRKSNKKKRKGSKKKSNKQKRRQERRKNRQDRRSERGPTAGPTIICQEIFATGLRNPYRIAFDPNDAQRFFINDVGGNGFEEVNRGAIAADYGWNVREGPCPINAVASNCAPDGRFKEPVFAYGRSGVAPFGGCRAITGGAFVPDSANWFPGEDVYLFADLYCGTIFELRDETPGDAVPIFASGEGASDLVFGPDGALYYTAYFLNAVHRIALEP